MTQSLPKAALVAALVLAPLSGGAVETVKAPAVEKGELEIEHKGKYQHDASPARDDEKEFEFALAYGITERWKAEMETEYEQKRGADLAYKKFKFENVYALGSEGDGDYLDSALYGDIALADKATDSHSLTGGILLRKNFSDTTHTANILLKTDFGDTATMGTNLIYRWQTRYNLARAFEPGFEILGDTRKKDAFRDQHLKIGPALYGTLPLGGTRGEKIGYSLGYFFGATPSTPDGTLRWALEYELHF